MKISNIAKEWTEHQTPSHITVNLDKSKFIRFDSGENPFIKMAVPYPNPTATELKDTIAKIHTLIKALREIS